jgi:hypothetical protein
MWLACAFFEGAPFVGLAGAGGAAVARAALISRGLYRAQRRSRRHAAWLKPVALMTAICSIKAL